MNAAIKLLAFVGQSAQRALDIVAQREPATADLIAARRIIVGMRADLDEADQRIRQEIARRVQRPNPLVPPHASITDRQVDDYAARLHAGGSARDDGAEDEVIKSIACDRAIESPAHRAGFSPGSSLPRGRYVFDHHARRLVSAG
jgi:hypothetical protein